jgi:hypothetical protein
LRSKFVRQSESAASFVGWVVIEGSEPLPDVSSENDTNAIVCHWKLALVAAMPAFVAIGSLFVTTAVICPTGKIDQIPV